MGQFGSELRLERERRGISLETMCALTKLSLRQLLDLEAENYDQLPGGVFRKGFVRSYLGAIGLDESSWIERFEASYRASGLASADEIDWASFAENVRNGRAPGQNSGARGRWLGVAAMFLLLLVLGWFLWQFLVHPRLNRSALQPNPPAPSLAAKSSSPTGSASAPLAR
jgi:cytoskeleton protein RodZ